MAPMRPLAGMGLAMCRAYARAAATTPRPRDTVFPGVFSPRPFSACVVRRSAPGSLEEVLRESQKTRSSRSPPSKADRPRRTVSASRQTGQPPFPEFPNFFPRATYQPPIGTLKSYFIGHHRTALVQMRVKLASVGLVIECRDLRVPLSSANPLLEATLMNTRVGPSPKTLKFKLAKAARAAAQAKELSGGADETPNETPKTLEDFDRDDGKRLPGLSGNLPPAATRNPLLSVGDTNNRRMRIIVYTKRDLLQREDAKYAPTEADLRRLAAMDSETADAVIFLGNHHADKDAPHWQKKSAAELRTLMKAVRQAARAHGERSLTPLYALVVGMPNSGKSTLLNRLRAEGMTDANARSNVSRTGSEAGVTRRIGTPVRVLEETSKIVGTRRPVEEGEEEEEEEYTGSSGGENAGLLVYDTPGVFMPYVPDAETMTKLALVSTVRENMVMVTALADYLLFRINQCDPKLYMDMYGLTEPTDDPNLLLDAIAQRTGKLGSEGVPDQTAAAHHFVSAFRQGRLGNFCLDDLSTEALDKTLAMVKNGPPLSLNQAKKREKVLKKHLQAVRRGLERSASLTEY